MLKTINELKFKQQIILIGLFAISYFSPLVGCILVVFFVVKKADKVYRNIALLGTVSALLFYSLGYLISIL